VYLLHTRVERAKDEVKDERDYVCFAIDDDDDEKGRWSRAEGRDGLII
jgi:hypothetical protein